MTDRAIRYAEEGTEHIFVAARHELGDHGLSVLSIECPLVSFILM
jgi:hypothetical protein